MPEQKRTTCTYHCASCDLHFSALNAFDAHRRFGGCTSRPKNSKQVEYIPRDGICNLTKGRIGQEMPAVIWGRDAEIDSEGTPERSRSI